MKFGLKDNDFNFIDENVVKPLNKLNAKVWVFGSRARNDYQPFSDLDLYIETKDDISRELESLKEQVINSDVSIKIDFVLSKDLAKSYEQYIEKDKILWR